MSNTCAILLAAGKGERLKARVPKALANVAGKPLVSFALTVLQRCAAVDAVVLVVPAGYTARFEALVRLLGCRKVCAVVPGGSRRQDSVRAGLAATPAACDTVLVHDSARPFADEALIKSVVRAAKRYGAAIPGVPVKATVKRVGKGPAGTAGIVRETIPRSELWEVQTPQGFCRDVLQRAFARFGRYDVTDDAMLVEKTGARVAMVQGSYQNIKVTTPEDRALAAMLARGKGRR